MDYTPDPETGLLTAEYVDIFGVPFSLIPFKGREPGGGTPPDDRPKHEVMALPERNAYEIRFPVVEGYVVALKRNLITADVNSVERTALDAWILQRLLSFVPRSAIRSAIWAHTGGLASNWLIAKLITTRFIHRQ